MSTQLRSGTLVQDPSTGFVGMLLGPFTRRHDKWWTIHWEETETTAESEMKILNTLELLE